MTSWIVKSVVPFSSMSSNAASRNRCARSSARDAGGVQAPRHRALAPGGSFASGRLAISGPISGGTGAVEEASTLHQPVLRFCSNASTAAQCASAIHSRANVSVASASRSGRIAGTAAPTTALTDARRARRRAGHPTRELPPLVVELGARDDDVDEAEPLRRSARRRARRSRSRGSPGPGRSPGRAAPHRPTPA